METKNEINDTAVTDKTEDKRYNFFGDKVIRETGTSYDCNKLDTTVLYVKPLPKYKCSKCSFIATRYKLLVDHVSDLHKKKDDAKYKCKLCSYGTDNKAQLYNHLTVHNNKSREAVYKCKICKDSSLYSKEELEAHRISHAKRKENVFQCNTCSYKTVNEESLNQHLLYHVSSSDMEIYRCGLCAFETKFSTVFKKHSKIHQKQLKDNSEKHDIVVNEKYTIVTDQTDTLRQYKCSTCSFTTKDRVQMESHGSLHSCFTSVCGLCRYMSDDTVGMIEHFVGTHR